MEFGHLHAGGGEDFSNLLQQLAGRALLIFGIQHIVHQRGMRDGVDGLGEGVRVLLRVFLDDVERQERASGVAEDVDLELEEFEAAVLFSPEEAVEGSIFGL